MILLLSNNNTNILTLKIRVLQSSQLICEKLRKQVIHILDIVQKYIKI